MTVVEIARTCRVHPTTVCRWIRAGCPCDVLGSVGRGHGTTLTLDEVQRWRVAHYAPSLVRRDETDAVLKVVATALYDVLKRDGLDGPAAERMALLVYARVYLNLTHTALEPHDLPDELKRVGFNYIQSVEEHIFHRR